MNVVSSPIQFNGYNVIRASFESFDCNMGDDPVINLKPEFSREVEQISDNEYAVQLSVKIHASNKEGIIPFDTEVVIKGFFAVDGIEDKDKAMKINGVAILFPYLRSTLSTMTTLMNIPPVVLPTINLIRMFEEEQ